MSITNPTELTTVHIGAADRSTNAMRVDLWRTVNSVGRWRVALRNTGGTYNNTFDIQNQFLLNVNGPANTLMQGRVDGPGVILQGGNVETTWDEYVVVSGVDQSQDLLFENDFEYTYPNFAQQIHTVLNDIFNIRLAGRTNIVYAPPGASSVMGGIEFRKGTGFLSTLQEMFSRTDWLFYVDDNLVFRSGAPGFPGSGTGVTLKSVLNDPTNNIIGPVTFVRRDGDKLYNKIEVYSKNPQFDAYTEYTANRWATVGGGWAITNETVIIAPIIGNVASIKMQHTPPPALANASITLDFSQMGLDEVDMSSGEIGFWFRYAGGTSAARACARVALQDNALNTINFYSGEGTPGVGPASTINRTRTVQGEWGWCTVPVGYDIETGIPTVPDTWWTYPIGGFNWDRVTDMAIQYQTFGADTPNEFEIDGLRLPFSARGFAEDTIISQPTYRIRPLIIHLSYARHQLALEEKADQLLRHHRLSGIDLLKLTVPGNLALRYAGQTVTVNIPRLGLNGDLFYLTEIHHAIQPYTDISEGYGFDWITELEMTPVNSLMYDMSRFRDGGLFSGVQLGAYSGAGLRAN